MVFYEVMWFMDHDDLIQDDFEETFDSAEAALKYYKKHKNDEGKYGWKVTKRGCGFKVLKYFINDWGRTKTERENLIKYK